MVASGIANQIDREDRLRYVVAPQIAYAALAAAGVTASLAPQAAGVVLAIATCLLLLVGVRNAWAMTTWVLVRRRESVRSIGCSAPSRRIQPG